GNNLTLGVVGVGLEAELYRGFVGFRGVDQVLDEACGLTDEHGQDACRCRIQCTGVSDPLLTAAPAHEGDDIVRRPSRRLVDVEDAAKRQATPRAATRPPGEPPRYGRARPHPLKLTCLTETSRTAPCAAPGDARVLCGGSLRRPAKLSWRHPGLRSRS